MSNFTNKRFGDMSLGFRKWMFAIAILLVVEDFQYLLRIEASALEQIEDFTEDRKEEESENSSHKEEDKKEEQKDEKDNLNPDSPLSAYLLLTRNDFRDAVIFLSNGMRELESPPPEV